MGFWPLIKKVISESDIILEVIDARMPGMSRNRELESLVRREGKQLVRVANKIDIVSEDFMRHLRFKNKDYYFVSGTKNTGLAKLKRDLLIMGKRMGIKEPKIGVVGYPNTGKSAIINALCKRNKAKVSDIAGTTRNVQWIKAGSLRILDSPGVVPFDDDELKLGLLGAKNPEKLKNKEKVVEEIIKKLVSLDKKVIEDYYGIEVKEGMDEYEILLAIGKKKGFLVKGGIVDENRTIFQILKDWQKGKIAF